MLIDWDWVTGTRRSCAQTAAASRPRWRSASGSRRRLLPGRGHGRGQRQHTAQRRPGHVCRWRRPSDDPAGRRRLHRGDLGDGRQVDRDLRRGLRRRAPAHGAGAQADRPLPEPLRPQPCRPVRDPATARRRRQAGRQAAVPAPERGGDALRPRPGADGLLRRRWRWRSSPSATSRTGSASTGSTSRSASSTSSPPDRSASTACCSAAGHRARSTASSARCARPRS